MLTCNSSKCYWQLTFNAYHLFQNCLILFGGTCKKGVVSNETWIFNITLRQWTLLKNPVGKPVGVTGHTATVVGNDMIVLFGYSPDQGVTNLIQVFGLGKCNVHEQVNKTTFLFFKLSYY